MQRKKLRADNAADVFMNGGQKARGAVPAAFFAEKERKK